jgi:ATP-dependent Zn protease
VSIVRRSEALGYVLPVPNYDIYAEPLRNFVAYIMVGMAGHVATKLFLGEYWTGATGDFQNVRGRLWQLAHYGYFGPPIAIDGTYGVGQNFRDKSEQVEEFWQKLEDQTTQLLLAHKAEVEAVAQVLLLKSDITGKECIQIIRSAAASQDAQVLDSELLLKTLVDETIINGKSAKKPKTKRKTKSKATSKTE